jgi:large subunit ribosomal protein L11
MQLIFRILQNFSLTLHLLETLQSNGQVVQRGEVMGCSRRKVIATVKLELEAGRATPAPPVGRDLGPHGVNLAEFVRRYNDATRGREGMVIPVVVTIYEDRSFDFVMKTPPTAFLLRRAAGVEKGAGAPGNGAVGTVTQEQLR